jgi:preprotein translocase subunit SecE
MLGSKESYIGFDLAFTNECEVEERKVIWPS